MGIPTEAGNLTLQFFLEIFFLLPTFTPHESRGFHGDPCTPKIQGFSGTFHPNESQGIRRGPRTKTATTSIKFKSFFFCLHSPPMNPEDFMGTFHPNESRAFAGDPEQRRQPYLAIFSLYLFSFAYFSFLAKRKVGFHREFNRVLKTWRGKQSALFWGICRVWLWGLCKTRCRVVGVAHHSTNFYTFFSFPLPFFSTFPTWGMDSTFQIFLPCKGVDNFMWIRLHFFDFCTFPRSLLL